MAEDEANIAVASGLWKEVPAVEKPKAEFIPAVEDFRNLRMNA